MKNNPCVLTLDFGTQSLRTSLIDNNGDIKCIIKAHYEPAYFSKEKGFADQRQGNGPLYTLGHDSAPQGPAFYEAGL